MTSLDDLAAAAEKAQCIVDDPSDPKVCVAHAELLLFDDGHGNLVCEDYGVKTDPTTVLRLVAVYRAAKDIGEGKFIDVDGETQDEWCHWCESMRLADHEPWCDYIALRAALAALEEVK